MVYVESMIVHYWWWSDNAIGSLVGEVGFFMRWSWAKRAIPLTGKFSIRVHKWLLLPITRWSPLCSVITSSMEILFHFYPYAIRFKAGRRYFLVRGSNSHIPLSVGPRDSSHFAIIYQPRIEGWAVYQYFREEEKFPVAAVLLSS